MAGQFVRGRRLVAVLILLSLAAGLAAWPKGQDHAAIPPPHEASGVPAGPLIAQETEHPEPTRPAPPLSAKQRKELVKFNFDKMKRDTEELAALAKLLQDELGKSNDEIQLAKIAEKSERIEKLARRIKGVARGY